MQRVEPRQRPRPGHDPRSDARLLAVQALCSFEMLGDAFGTQLESFLHDAENHADLGLTPPVDPNCLALARTLAQGAWQTRNRADTLIRTHAPQWAINRLVPVERNILRLGLHELLEDHGTPPKVVLDEAVKMAHLLGGNESPSFINGVLDAIRRALRNPPPPTAPPEDASATPPATPGGPS